MQVYVYAKSGHNFGLENVRRSSAICNMLKEFDPILCTADYRAATFAKSELGIGKGVGVDVIGNLPHVMERGDILIYDDSGEASDTMQEHMKDFCTHLYKVGDDIPFDIVDEVYTTKSETKNEKAIFFSDDDYSEWFLNFCQNSTKQDLPLVLGHYFFFGNEDKLKPFFSDILEEDEYMNTILSTKYLLTASVQAAIESLSCGNNPVFFQRGDKDVEHLELIEKYNIPVIKGENLEDLIKEFDQIITKYPELKSFSNFDISDIKNTIDETLKKFAMIQPALEYKF